MVLECEPGREKLLLSLKPSLVASELPRVASYAAATPGVRTHGVVGAIRAR